jgi:putative RNA 2'-phosphotransferase
MRGRASDSDLIRMSKLMSLILRHKPEQFAVLLDPEGYVSIEDLVRAVRRSFPNANAEDVRRVVETVERDKARFSISGSDIRANYGHSLSEKIAQPRVVPPEVLLHGTSEEAVPGIRQEGIRPMRRQYVHLTASPDLAARVGGRHGKARVLEVEALRASHSGVVFYRANEAFWLADFVPSEFIR